LLHGEDCGAEGLLTSGGTESILIAFHGYREQARQRGIDEPEVICCVTAHPAIDKACHYFGMKLTKLSADESTLRLTRAIVEPSINANVICVYASAPNFPHGVVDDAEGLSALCVEKGIGLHVDNCLGGFWLSHIQKEGLGRSFDWDFKLAGVTTVSIDVHKYGFASKGASVVAFRTNELRAMTYVPVLDGSALYVTSTMQGSRSGAIMAAAWGTLLYFGDNGYRESARKLHGLHREAMEAVRQTPGLRLACEEVGLHCD